MVMQRQNCYCKHRDSKTHKDILGIVIIFKTDHLFIEELAADNQRKADTDNRYEIVPVNYLHAFFLPRNLSKAL